MNQIAKPFLWMFMKTVQKDSDYTGGQEHIITESLAEESRATFAEITFGS